MQKIFLAVVDMSIVSSLVILAVLLVRALLKRAPRRFAYALWAAVLLRLLCPFAVESPLSLIPERAGVIAQSAALPESENVSFVSAASAAYRAIGDTANGGQDFVRVEVAAPAVNAAPGVEREEAGRQYVAASHGQVWLLLCAWLWPAGTAAVLAWGVVGQIKLRRMLVGAVRLEGNVWLADHIPTAFVMGLARPKIYLPSSLEGPGRDYVLSHERAHVRRGDHVTRLLAFAALALHWFNPLVWLAFAMSGRDMEMSCDEAVMRRSGGDIRADYCQTLLDMSANKHFPSPCLLAFGEGDTGARVRNALRWKKPAFWAVCGAAVLIVAACVLLLTNQAAKMSNSVEISFPAYQDGRKSGADELRYDAAYDRTPFTMSVTLPKGWTAGTPEELRVRTAGDSGEPAADGCALYTPVQLYDGKGRHAGFVGWSDFYEFSGYVPEGDYYKTVYLSLRQGAHYAWADYETVRSDEYTETHTATVYYQTPAEDVPAAAWPQRTAPGVCHYDKRLGVYVAIQFDEGAATEKEISQIAGSISLSMPGQDSGATEITFPGAYTDADGVERGSGPFTASMELPEGWTVRERAGGEHISSTMMLESKMYLFDELGNNVGSVGYRAFDPDAEMPLIKRYASMSDADYFRTRVFGELILEGEFRNGLEFVCGTRTCETSRSREYGQWYNGNTGESRPFNVSFLCHYDTELNEYIVIMLDEEYITVRELDTLAKSISLRRGAAVSGGSQTVKVSFPGRYVEDGKSWNPGPFAATLALPEGWSVRSGWSMIPEGTNGEGYSPVYLRDAEDVTVGKITYRAFDPDNPAQVFRAGSWSDLDYARVRYCNELYRSGNWLEYETVSYSDTAETFRGMVSRSTVVNDSSAQGYHVESETRYGIGRYDTELGVYVTIELRESRVSEREAALIAGSLALEPVSLSARATLIDFGGLDYSDGTRRGSGKFAAMMYLPEGWSARRDADVEGLPDTHRLLSPAYIYDENGKCVAFAAWAGFDPNAYAEDTTDRGLSTAVNAELPLRTDWAQRGWNQYSISADAGTAYIDEIIDGDGVNNGRRGICAYSRKLGAYVCVEFADGQTYDWAARLIAGSISLQGLPDAEGGYAHELTASGYYYAGDALVECRPFTAFLTLPEGWTLTGGVDGVNTFGMQPMAYMFDSAGNYAGFVGWRELAARESGTVPLGTAGFAARGDAAEANGYSWEYGERMASGGTEVYTMNVSYDAFDESGARSRVETVGIRAESGALGVYLAAQFEPGAISGEALSDMARGVRLEPRTAEYVPGFGGFVWGAERETIENSLDDPLTGNGPLRWWSLAGLGCMAYYGFDENGQLSGGYYGFRDDREPTPEEKKEQYKRLLAGLEEIYGEGYTTMFPGELEGISGKSDVTSHTWTKQSPDGGTVYISLGTSGGETVVRYTAR